MARSPTLRNWYADGLALAATVELGMGALDQGAFGNDSDGGRWVGV
jgi:hypothetical protein